MLNEDDRILLATLVEEELTKARRILKEAVELGCDIPETHNYVIQLQDLLSRVLFS